jgi:hypothetical protein
MRDPAVGIAGRGIQRQRAPAATQIEHPLAIGQLRPLRGQVQHALLSRVERIVVAPEPAAVLVVTSQDLREKCGGHFIVLLVGRGRMHRQRTRLQSRDVPKQVGTLGRHAAFVFFSQPILQQAPYADPDHPVRHQIPLDE